jgi:hypothetical protein
MSGAGMAGLAGCINPLSSDDSNPEFSVAIQETNAPITTGDVLTVRVRVRNEGDSEARKTVTLSIGDQSSTRDVTLSPGGVSDIEFRQRITDSDGEIEILAETEFSAATQMVEIRREMFTEYNLEVISIRNELIDGERFTVEVQLSNQGTAEETHELQLYFEGFSDPVVSQSVTLGEDDSETVMLEWVTEGAAISNSIEVRYADQSVERDVTIREPADPQLEVNSAQSQIYVGQSYTLDVAVGNRGEVSVSNDLVVEIAGETITSESISLEGGERVQETFEWTPAVGIEGTLDVAVTFGEQSFSESLTVERAVRQVESRVRTTYEDFAEVVELTLSNDSPIEQERVVEGEITTTEEETFSGSIFGESFELTRPADTFTNQRPVTIPPNTEKMFVIKIPTGMWRFDAASKFGGDSSEPTWLPSFTHEAQVIRIPDAEATLNDWEKVVATEGTWEYFTSNVLLPTTFENVTSDPADVTVIGLIENLQGDQTPATAQRDLQLEPGETHEIELSVDITDIEFEGFEYIEISGVRDNPGSAPGLVELV